VTPAATYAELAETLATLRLGMTASELHGSLAGYLCAGGTPDPRNWLHELAIEDAEDAGDAEHAVLDRLFAGCAEGLEDPELSFEPLLPDDDEPIGERAGALVEWCRGFLGGLGLSGAELQGHLSGESDEVLHDLGRIAATRFDRGDTAEEDEDAYAEVVEYVRVGVMLLHNEIAGQPRNATRH
jgi:yecA family protein